MHGAIIKKLIPLSSACKHNKTPQELFAAFFPFSCDCL